MRGGACHSNDLNQSEVNELPDKISLDYTFPEVSSNALFSSPRDIISSAYNLFNRMIKRLREHRKGERQNAFQRRKVTSQRTGRKVRLVGYRKGHSVLAPYESVINAIRHGTRFVSDKAFTVNPQWFLGWERQVQESLTLILGVDVSASTLPAKDVIARVISALSASFKRHRDRIGLVAIHGYQAEILNHPSRNHRVVAKSILQLEVKGLTPLGDGLIKCLEMVKIEKIRNPGSKPVVIALTDCYPEPISREYTDLMDEPMYRQAKSAADQFRKRHVPLLIINPSYQDPKKIHAIGSKYRRPPGDRLCDEMVRRSRGKMVRLHILTQRDSLKMDAKLVNEKKQMREIFRSIEAAFSGGQGDRSDFGMTTETRFT